MITPDSHDDQPAGRKLSSIPVRTEMAAEGSCDESGVFALQVLGESMLPEFEPGDIIVVEPDGLLRDGSFVVARADDGWILRQLQKDGQTPGGWFLIALAPGASAETLIDLSSIRGVVIQKSRPGRRKTIKRYVD